MPVRALAAIALAAILTTGAAAQTPAPRRQVEIDAWTRYELLAPGSGKFRIVYEVTDATPGAVRYWNPIRKGSVASDESVSDRATGKPLEFHVVSGEKAKADGLPQADAATDYIEVQLAHAIPEPEGQARILILKTYLDAKSYYQNQDVITFERPLGIKRNVVVLPPGYEILSSNYPSQVLQEADGRIAISFFNTTPAEAPLILTARPARVAAPAKPAPEGRAHQSRDIVYFLKEPQTHAFDLYHDYTETAAGEDRYVNVVRAGSHAQSPSGINLDTGEPLTTRIVRGDDITALEIHDPGLTEITPDTEVVLFGFKPLKAGESARLRMRETYADPVSYRLDGDTLVFDRTFGRPTNSVVLPAGWILTSSSIPATVQRTPDGRVRLDFRNDRPDEIHVVITARRK
jgi:hypothetical protein